MSELDKDRAEFEAWATEQGLIVNYHGVTAEHIGIEVNKMAWQASAARYTARIADIEDALNKIAKTSPYKRIGRDDATGEYRWYWNIHLMACKALGIQNELLGGSDPYDSTIAGDAKRHDGECIGGCEPCQMVNDQAKRIAEIEAEVVRLRAAGQRSLDWLASYPGGGANGCLLQMREAMKGGA